MVSKVFFSFACHSFLGEPGDTHPLEIFPLLPFMFTLNTPFFSPQRSNRYGKTKNICVVCVREREWGAD